MSNFSKEIKQVNIEEEMKRSYLDYSMSVIIGRALPDVRDGLKPVHRRVLFAMNVLDNNCNKPYKKSARIVGDVIGKYHPHGDTAVYDTIVRMAQPFSLRYMLIDGQGNFGSVDGDSAAAMRYTEVRMSKITNELLADLEKETVDYVLNYDGTEHIPNVLPTKIPNLLINGAAGIAVGMATNIPPHNLSEVIDACLAYIDNENISIEDIMKYITGPDFPTAAIIHGRSGIEQAYRTGRGKIYIRANTDIKIDNKTGRESIIVNEIPYQVNKSHLIEKIVALIKEKRVEGIHSLRDESDKDGMRIVIEIKRDAIGEVVLKHLYSLTPLQVSFCINMVALHKGQPKIMPLKDILSAFINHRREVVTRRTMYELRKNRERAYILEALAIAIVNIDSIITLIRKSKKPSQAKYELVERSWEIGTFSSILAHVRDSSINNNDFLESRYGINAGRYYLTEQQAQAILDIRLQNLTSLEHEKLLNEYKELLNKKKEFIQILKNPQSLIEVIRQELIIIKEQYTDPRRTQITTNTSDINIEDLIKKEEVVVTLSYQGYVKYQPITEYEAQKRGGKGKSAANIKEEDFIDCMLVANTHDIILLFSSTGRTYWMKVYQLPESSRSARGRPILNLLPLELNERITAILPISEYKTGYYVFMSTAKGIVKKTAMIEFSRPRSAGIISIHLHDKDELIGVNITDGNNDVMLFSAYGKVVRFPENQVRTMRRNATGVRGINLEKGDRVVSLIIPHGNGTILTVTKYGYGKRTELIEFPTKSRATRGVISTKINERNGKVVGAIQVDNFDQIVMITNVGKLIRTRVSEVNIIGRNTQGVMLIRTAPDKYVVGLQRIA